MTSHDHYAEAVAAYALNALDHSERAAFEVHLSTCAQCRAELADMRRVTAGIGLSVKPENPPDSLRARVLNHVAAASADARPRASAPTQSVSAAVSRMPWLVAAASLAIAIGSLAYAWTLRSELRSVRQLAADATERVDTLRTELMRLRQDSSRLQQVVNVINAPDVRELRLGGVGPGQSASGLALWSQATGLVVTAKRLPPLEPGRGYELWAITGGKPISVGMVTVAPNGTASHSASLPASLNVEAVAISIEQAGGSATGQPEGDIVLLGKLAG